MIKRFIIALILLVLVCGGLVGFNMFRDQAIEQFFANMPAQTMSVSTTKLEPISWTPGIEAIGTVSAARGVDLTVETTGIVKEIRFKANDRVKQGAVLVQLDDAIQRADLAAAQAQANLDKTNLQRAQELQRRRVGTEVNVESARAAADASAAQVQKLQASLDQKQLRAPFDGVIGIPRIDIGQYIQPGTTVATLQDLETMRVDFTVPEQRLAELKIDQPIRLGVGDGEMPFTGTIRGIDPKIDPITRLVSIRAEVANPEGRLSPGQFVQVRVELPQQDNVLAVPQTALVTSLYGDYVYVVRPAQKQQANGQTAPAAEGQQPAAEGEAKPQAEPAQPQGDAAQQQQGAQPQLAANQIFVKIGRRNQGLVEIVEGLKPGDEVITAGQNRLSNGTPVTVAEAADQTNPDNTQAAAQ